MTITYNYVLDGGNWPATETRNGVRSGLYGTAVEVPTAVPTKDDCQFDGWDYDATTFDLYNGNATRTITAKWKSVASGDLEADITWTGEIKFTSDQKNKTLTAQKPSDVGTWVFKWYYNKYGEGDGAYTGPSTGETFSYSSFDAGRYSVLLIGEHTINGITTPYTTTIGMTIE